MSEKPKWTPGPHVVIDEVDAANVGRRVVAGGRVVAQCECLDPEENQANATLFAAAETLYEALEDLIGLAEAAMSQANNDGAEYDVRGELATAQNVLALARGEAP